MFSMVALLLWELLMQSCVVAWLDRVVVARRRDQFDGSRTERWCERPGCLQLTPAVVALDVPAG